MISYSNYMTGEITSAIAIGVFKLMTMFSIFFIQDYQNHSNFFQVPVRSL